MTRVIVVSCMYLATLVMITVSRVAINAGVISMHSVMMARHVVTLCDDQ